MQTVTDAAALRAAVRAWRSQGHAIGFVPTMGNLHAGHHSLLRIARSRAERVVASVFVNPTQFGPNEDYARYPRTLAQDQAGLAAHGCDLLFAPDVATMYPSGPERTVTVSVPGVTATLEGAHRPGHFDGVATVVTKLLNLVQPDVAVFGQKDWQQLLVVKTLVRDLALPVQIVPGPTVREADGLALSSRNQYLSADERARAPAIHATLEWMRAQLRAGHPREVVEAAARGRLEQAGFAPDYAVVRRAEDLAEPAAGEDSGLIALIAARLGATRLIDNLPFDGL
ncbi:MAG: pantoate--beta-alanine ligase [Mizugakiibacter sp.]|uniref:pantoate--beta-alanine ligase n=1 Tax=Mizugakiibacter sp. TaxID=1972610 RepID=UPI0031C161F9|nr:pantoate--beta-alanine ligase [Xanthomonadaceae bacterium]